MNLPEEHEIVMVTYNKTFLTGLYSDKVEKREVTKRGFYEDEKFHVPPRWSYFRIGGVNCLLPDGFGGDHLSADKIISWKYCE